MVTLPAPAGYRPEKERMTLILSVLAIIETQTSVTTIHVIAAFMSPMLW